MSLRRTLLACLLPLLSLGGSACASDTESASSESYLTETACGFDTSAPDSPRRLFDKPFATDDDAETRFVCMRTILDKQKDHRGIFATLYTNTTKEIRRGVDEGRVEDAAYVRELIRMFAELYRQAFVAHADGDPRRELAGAWKVALDAAIASNAADRAGRPDNVLVLQHLMMGVNAHVNHDLSHAMAIVGLRGQSAGDRKHDYDVVRTILKENVDSSFNLVIDRYAQRLGELPERLREVLGKIFLVWLVVGREKAWIDGLALLQGGPIESLTDKQIELTSREFGEALLLANGIAPDLMARLKQAESSP